MIGHKISTAFGGGMSTIFVYTAKIDWPLCHLYFFENYTDNIQLFGLSFIFSQAKKERKENSALFDSQAKPFSKNECLNNPFPYLKNLWVHPGKSTLKTPFTVN